MSATVTVERLDCDYLVPREHPDPSGIAFRLDGVLRGGFQQACAAAFAAVLDEGDGAVWVIRRLDAELDLPLGESDEDTLGRLWAAGLAHRIADVVHGREHVADVMRFPDRAAYLAAFARDLGAGQAWQSWVYEPLAGMAALSTGRAIVSAAARYDLRVVELIAELARTSRLAPLLDVLGDDDAAALCQALKSETAAIQPRRADIDLVLQSRPAIASGRPAAMVAMRLLTTALQPHIPAGQSDRLVATAVVLAELGAEHPTSSIVDLLAAATADPEPRWLARIAGTIPTATGQVVPPGRTATQPATTAHAGVLLLLPGLLDLGFDEIVNASTADAGQAARLRHLVLTRCLGPHRLAAAGRDPVLRAICGRPDTIDDSPDPPLSTMVHQALADRDREFVGTDGAGALAAAGIRLFARRLPGFGASTFEHLHTNVYGVAGTVLIRRGLVEATLEPAPLQVLLRLAGLDEATCQLPWLDSTLVLRCRENRP